MKKVASSFFGGLFSFLQKGGQWWVGRYRSSGKRGKVMLGCGSLFAACFACTLFSIPFTSTPTPTPKTAVSSLTDANDVAVEDGEKVVNTVQPLGLAALEDVEETAVSPTDTAEPSKTSEPTTAPTDTPNPTNTPQPTETPRPTSTPRSTETPRPTNTPEPEPLVEIAVPSANLRSGPGTSYNSVGALMNGDVVEVIAQTNDGSWYNVELDDGSFGWIGVSVAVPVVANSLANIPVAATIPAPPVVVEAPPPTSPPAEPTDVPTSAPTEPAPEPTAVPAPTDPPPPTSSAPAGCVDINNAGIEDLKRIIHIDDIRAVDLIALRPYTSVDQLTRIKGIGPSRVADIKAEGIACVS